ncbi:LysR family transcriptional regulator [Dechloromonas sp.]|uniref:LysR family transcriptional regulator n=1 Tax=Dechloromonas sp. TaxID=1917218 RepID=UPI00121479B4|nr:LysR family transcriptional regulator [Dechloromonas sp.]MBU3697562.1 LysR family transcriptional regulator [Dechloromonas sp.]TEX47016.1 MAG: LysR family transcriptional regulator [Rhodocyclaceae bacterium]
MPRRRITFRQLETFAQVARLGSFTRAADALHLTQPAISIQIRQIADTLGMPLFEQIGRDISLTPAGQLLMQATRELDDVWNRFESSIDDLKGLKRGKLRVALVTTAKYFLPRMLGAFCQRYPDIEIELEIANRERIVERLRSNQDDLYIMSYPPADLDIVARPFLENALVIVAAPGHWAVGRQVTLAELAGEHFLLREQGSGSRHAVDRHLAAVGMRLNVRLSLASNEAIRDLAASGMGLGVLSRHALDSEPARDGIAILDVEGFPIQQAWNVVHLDKKLLSVPARAFLDDLLKLHREG